MWTAASTTVTATASPGFVLTRVAPDQYAMIPQEAGQPRPRAFEYCLFFSSLTPQSAGWHRIDFLRDARRGDIIALAVPGNRNRGRS